LSFVCTLCDSTGKCLLVCLGLYVCPHFWACVGLVHCGVGRGLERVQVSFRSHFVMFIVNYIHLSPVAKRKWKMHSIKKWKKYK